MYRLRSFLTRTPPAEAANGGQPTQEEQMQATTSKTGKVLRSNASGVDRKHQFKADSERQIQISHLDKTAIPKFVGFDKRYESKAEGEKLSKNCERSQTSNVPDFQIEDLPKAKEQKETKSYAISEYPRTRSFRLETKNQGKAVEQKLATKIRSCIEEVEKAEDEERQERDSVGFKAIQYRRTRKSKPNVEYKILILGSTGVGKSTFINGFANYLKYTTLSEALKSKPEYPIPSTFKVRNEKYQDIEIKMGDWKGPAQKSGESVTQECCGYDFETPLGKVTLIDSPGIDDTEGLDQDEINCEKIIEYLRNYEDLSAVCILVKSNCSRENAAFEFCLKQLFSQLPKSITDNICFVFTHGQTATVPFEMGNTAAMIENFVKKVQDISDVNIPFGQNCFSVDNEGLRMVAQYHSGQRNFRQRKSVYVESWNRSEEECAKLVDYISRLTPQPVKNIIFLNKALKVINLLYEEGSEINTKIQELNNITNVTSNTLNGLSLCQQYLEQKRYAIATEHIVRPLEFDRFVCKEENCPIVESLGHLPKLAKESCHSDCKLDCLPVNGRCKSCGCHWDKHEHVNYELFEPGDPIEDEIIVMQLSAQLDVLNYLSSDLNTYQKNLNEMQASVRMLEAAAVAFAKFMKETPIAVNQEGISDPMVVSLLKSPGCPKTVTMADLETTLEALFALPSGIGMKLKTSIGNLLMVKDATS